MPNNTDLIKKIEEMEKLAREADDWFPMEITERLISVLQRAREALRWIPVTERLPEKNGAYEVWVRTDSLRGGYTDTVYFLDGTWPTDLEIQAWRPQIPYTPEEK